MTEIARNTKHIQKKMRTITSTVMAVFLFATPLAYAADTNPADANALKDQQQKIQANLSSLQIDINGLQNELDSTQTDLTQLRDKITDTQRKINDTVAAISEKQAQIDQLQAKVREEKSYLTEYIRVIYEMDQQNDLELFIQNDKISDFLNQIAYTQSVHDNAKRALDSIQNLQNSVQQEENALAYKQQQLAALRGTLEVEEGTLQQKEAEQQQQIAQKQQQAAASTNVLQQIRQQLYSLTGVPQDTTFGNALQLAQEASSLTADPSTGRAVRPAFLLAELSQESGWGAYVGSGNYHSDMNPSQVDAFLQICQSVGRDPETTQVSRKPQGYPGWGGALGPGQFLPTTWLAYAGHVQQLTGQPADPWSLHDAFIATALKLLASGAANGNTPDERFQAEWQAAMVYFAGSNWDVDSLGWYGDNVMSKAAFYQTQIDQLNAAK